MLKIITQINPFLNYCSDIKGLSAKTIKAYRIDLQQYVDFPNNNLSKDSLFIYLSHLHKTFSPKTARRKVATLKAFVHYLLMEEFLKSNPFERINTSFREPVILPKTIPINVIRQILSYAYSRVGLPQSEYEKKCAIRNVAILEMLFATGARVSEVCTLTPDQVDLTDHIINLFGKGSKERIIQIENSSVLKAISLYYETFKEDIYVSGFFFINKRHTRLTEQSVRAIINKYALAVGCEKHITPHMFRHSFATLLLEEDVDIRYIQKILGHSSITTTEIYTHVASVKQKEILTFKHPRNKLLV